ncbi:MAG: hypothetical protein J0L80_15815 [Chitinophagales bacterium]|nr:hypothetical protein [Chitinophagales bacterium]
MRKYHWYWIGVTIILFAVTTGAVYQISGLQKTKLILFTTVNALVFILSLVANILQIGGPRMFRTSIRNWNYSFDTAHSLLNKIEESGVKIDVVIGLGRSGGIWGGWIAGNLGSLPFYAIDVTYSVDEHGGRKVEFPNGIEILDAVIKSNSNILIIEGAASTGATFIEFKKICTGKYPNTKFKYAVLFKNSTAAISIDYVGKVIDNNWPKKFPWHVTDRYRTYTKE